MAVDTLVAANPRRGVKAREKIESDKVCGFWNKYMSTVFANVKKYGMCVEIINYWGQCSNDQKLG